MLLTSVAQKPFLRQCTPKVLDKAIFVRIYDLKCLDSQLVTVL